jgi:hypothetical protein
MNNPGIDCSTDHADTACEEGLADASKAEGQLRKTASFTVQRNHDERV